MIERVSHPFFSYYGSKFRLARYYPQPQYGKIVEPFAGSACYACHFPWLDVELWDVNEFVVGVWDFLIRSSERDILSLPLLEVGQDVNDLSIPQEAKWLIGFWVNRCMTRPGRALSNWGREGIHPWSFWSELTRSRVAKNSLKIKHWKVNLGSYEEIENDPATWFVDPPYSGSAGKKYESGQPDFSHLRKWCRSRLGLTIVCEHASAKWLNFRPFREVYACKGIGRMDRKNVEAIWTRVRREDQDMSKPSIYHELMNEAVASEHTAQVSEDRSSLAMSELFYEDARLWRRLADGWDVQTALTTSENAWKALCRKPTLRGKGFDPEEWNRRMVSYTGWRMSSILSGGESIYQIVKVRAKGETGIDAVKIGDVRWALKRAKAEHRDGSLVTISPSGRRYSWNDVFELSIFDETGQSESVYISLADEDDGPVHGGLLLGPVETLNSGVLELVKLLRNRYLIDHPEMAPGLGVDLVEVVSSAEGRLNGHPIWGEMFEEAVEG